jgi:hypothetical protein
MTNKTLIGLISLLLLALPVFATEVPPQHVSVAIDTDNLIKSGLMKRLREFKE